MCRKTAKPTNEIGHGELSLDDSDSDQAKILKASGLEIMSGVLQK